MTETTCTMCDARAESQWQIRLEREGETESESTNYRLCRGCWDDLQGRFALTDGGSS